MSQSSIDFTENGPVVPDTATVRDAVETDWQAAFDNRLNPDPATPQGQLITSETAIVQDKNSQLLFLSNMFNPETAEGIYQDALAKIYFLTRQARPFHGRPLYLYGTSRHRHPRHRQRSPGACKRCGREHLGLSDRRHDTSIRKHCFGVCLSGSGAY